MTTFATPEPVTVVLNIHSMGNVHLTATDRSDTVVEVRPTTATKSLDITHAENTVVEHSNGEVRITTPRHSLVSPRTRSVDITIQMPTGSKVRGKAPGGDFLAEGRLTEVEYSVSGGNITVGQVGTATLGTAAGDVRVLEAIRGRIKATTQAGNVDIGVSKNAAVALTTKTMHGSVSNSLSAEHDGRQVTERIDLDIRVMSGDITVHRSADDAATRR